MTRRGPNLPCARRLAVRCRCCGSTSVDATGPAVLRRGETFVPVLCRTCGFGWMSRAHEAVKRWGGEMGARR